MFCYMCGNQVANDAVFCQKCGAKQETELISQATETPVQTSVLESVEPTQQVSTVPSQVAVHKGTIDNNGMDFREFVDNHVRTTTKFQSADDLLKNSKPLKFIWICIGIPAIVGLVLGGPVGLLIFGGLFGYTATFIASGIIRARYRGKFSGEFIGELNIEDLFIFLNEHLIQIHPNFHEWGYLTKNGLLPILENAMANAMEEVRICSEFGPKKKNLIIFNIRPKTIDAKPGEKLYSTDAIKNGFLIDGRAAGFLGHGSLIRTAPILQAAMEYYLQTKKDN